MRQHDINTTIRDAVSALLLGVFAYVCQTYRYVSLEESYIFLFDTDNIISVLSEPGGLAQLLASFLSQFMRYPAAAPIIATILYYAIIALLSNLPQKKHILWVQALSLLPCIFLTLCIENTNYKLQGHTALLLSTILLACYTRIHHYHLIWGIALSVIGYIAAGSAALYLAIAMLIWDIGNRKRHKVWSAIYPLITIAIGILLYQQGKITTLCQALTPAMYYDWDSTYYMMLYALIALPVYVGIQDISQALSKPAKKSQNASIYWGIVTLLQIGIMIYLYSLIHNQSNYENMQMRHYARTGQWDAITRLPYNGNPTPYTSYRFLALAQQRQLTDHLMDYKPYVNYYFENKPISKKEDQQVLSDIYYACDYIGAAKHSAFDTDIVTGGSFNPYETMKLAKLHIVSGQYDLAEKYITLLEKTLFYRAEANSLRRFLNNDTAVEADAELHNKRIALPDTSNYMSPKNTIRDLNHIINKNPEQHTARQMRDALLTLTQRR